MRSAVLLGAMAALVAGQSQNPSPNIGINPNPNRGFDPATNNGNMGTFTVATQAITSGSAPPAKIDPATAQAMQLAIRNWMSDTTLVSQFQNSGKNIKDNAQFMAMADGAFKAEVDELTNKALLDKVIGNDPRVSIANQTLTNGVFQMVVDNLQIMSFQGTSKSNLIDTINQGRCSQVLPSIDTYMIVATELMQKSGISGFQSRAARPDACDQILKQKANDQSAFAPVPGTPFGNPKGSGDGNVQGVPGLSTIEGDSGNLGLVNSTSNNGTRSNSAGTGPTAGQNGVNGTLPVATTPQLGLPKFANQGSGGSPNGQSQNGVTVGTTPPGLSQPTVAIASTNRTSSKFVVPAGAAAADPLNGPAKLVNRRQAGGRMRKFQA